MGKEESIGIKLLRKGSIILSVFAILVGIISLFKGLNIFVENHEKAVIWFVLAVIALLIPYIKEITIKDLKVVINDLKEAKNILDATSLTAKQLHTRLTATRSELINGYQIYLDNLPPDKRDEKIIEMSKLYIQEMGLDVSVVKKWFKDLGYEVGEMNNEITITYINSIRSFQINNGLGNDGIFGYRTYDKICEVLKKQNIKTDNHKD